jgi:hypothetical protein
MGTTLEKPLQTGTIHAGFRGLAVIASRHNFPALNSLYGEAEVLHYESLATQGDHFALASS